MTTNPMILAALTMVAVAGILYAFVYPYLSGEAKAAKRQKAVGAGGVKRVGIDRLQDSSARRKQVADSLKELEARGKKRQRRPLEVKLTQAGLTWTKRKFYVISAGLAVAVAGILYFVSGELLYIVPGLIAGGLGIPNWLLSFLRKRRINKFIEEFPNAVDVIIRGVKAGLPLGDCLRIVATESLEPVRGEFRRIVEAQTMGLSMGEAVERIVASVPVAESNFFSIVINIQQRAGGNLSEALGNLSRVLRDRKKMKMKIKAMSSEAKASAGIIGALPFIVALLVYLSTPQYISLLWTTGTGRLVLAGSGFWMFIGVMVMKKMISFDM